MTVATQNSSIVLQGNGSNKDFAFDFEIPYQPGGTVVAGRVRTLIAGLPVVRTVTTDYTITAPDPTGGTVHYPVSGSALATGQWIEITRVLETTQESAFNAQSLYPPDIETALDQLEYQVQQTANSLAWQVLAPCNVSALPAAAVSIGVRGTVLDATASTFYSTVAGGGSLVVPVFCTGTAWKVG